jgi:hypothetical protein
LRRPGSFVALLNAQFDFVRLVDRAAYLESVAVSLAGDES